MISFFPFGFSISFYSNIILTYLRIYSISCYLLRLLLFELKLFLVVHLLYSIFASLVRSSQIIELLEFSLFSFILVTVLQFVHLCSFHCDLALRPIFHVPVDVRAPDLLSLSYFHYLTLCGLPNAYCSLSLVHLWPKAHL